MRMDIQHYLPHEVLKMRNYPEVQAVMNDIVAVQAYALTVDNAVFEYNGGIVDRINLNVVDLMNTVNTCRSICDVLGNATNVCYDLLLQIRELQISLQDLIYARKRFGSEYIGVPTPVTDEVII